jgi:hypothetical protein
MRRLLETELEAAKIDAHTRKTIQSSRINPFSTVIREGITGVLSFSTGNP